MAKACPLGRVLSGGRSAARLLLIAVARDDTRAGFARSCLVVAPHPDDETLGCGGSIAARAANGQRVVVAILTDGEAAATMRASAPDELAALRREEALLAASRLGCRCRPDGLSWVP